ncbi:MAG: ATP-dependent DNA helicase, partial [Kiritimatiellia bacterium]
MRPLVCPFATGYYERIRGAVESLFDEDDWSPARLARAAEEHRVCPHELSLDLIAWADLVVCDYNHVFDPRARIRRVFAADGPLPLAVLIDEAHNLPDRARDMFSAGLASGEIDDVLAALGPRSGPLGKSLRTLRKQFADLKAEAAEVNRRDFALEQIPPAFPGTWEQTLRTLDRWLETAPPSPARPAVLDLFFKLQALCDTADAFDDRHAVLVSLRGRGGTLRLFCADPSRRLAATFDQLHATVLFSGTLSPLELFRDLCGCPRASATLRLPSPFPPEHLDVRTATGVAVTYQQRDRSAGAVSALIRRFLQEQRGAALVFFPSYAYLDLIARAFEFETGFGVIALQRPGMSDEERAALAGRLGRPGGPTALFAVLGGSLGEAVEWPEALVSGAVIVGVGLPQVGLERDLIRALHDREARDGFAVAYRVPGMTRVIQAAGRVIRNETDRGSILLIDRRFSLAEYRDLFPPHWRVR